MASRLLFFFVIVQCMIPFVSCACYDLSFCARLEPYTTKMETIINATSYPKVSKCCRDEQNWTFIQHVPKSIEYLVIWSGDLRQIPNNTFVELQHLVYLSVIQANIVVIHPCSFCGLPRLKGLDLYGNKIHHGYLGTIAASLAGRNMSYLFFDNQVTDELEENKQDAIGSFKKLSVDLLSMTNNDLANIFNLSFPSMTKIKCLSLAKNNLNLNTRSKMTSSAYVYLIQAWKSLLMLDVSNQRSFVQGTRHTSVADRLLCFKRCMGAIEDHSKYTCNTTKTTSTIHKLQLQHSTDLVRLPRSLTRLYGYQSYVPSETSSSTEKPAYVGGVLPSCLTVADLSEFSGLSCVLPHTIVGCYNLQYLRFRKCNILDIQTGSFELVPSVRYLDFSFSRINPAMLARNVFQNLSHLETFVCERCGLTCGSVNQETSFIAGKSLRRLNLAENDLACFPNRLIKKLPKLQMFNMSDHQQKWFDSSNMQYMTDFFAKGNVGIAMAGNFLCICEVESIEFVHWYHKHQSFILDSNSTVCTLTNNSRVRIIDLNLDAFDHSCQYKLRIYQTSPPIQLYVFGIMSGVIVLILFIVLVVKRNKLLFCFLMNYSKCTDRGSGVSSNEFPLGWPDDDNDAEHVDHVTLLYVAEDGEIVKCIREQLVQNSCPVFDIDVGLVIGLDADGRPIFSGDWARAGNFRLDAFVRSLMSSKVAMIFTPAPENRDFWFRLSVNMVVEAVITKDDLRVVIIRNSSDTIQSALGWKVLRALRLCKGNVVNLTVDSTGDITLQDDIETAVQKIISIRNGSEDSRQSLCTGNC